MIWYSFAMLFIDDIRGDMKQIPDCPDYFMTYYGNVIGPKGPKRPNVNSSNGSLYTTVRNKAGKQIHIKIALLMLQTFVGPRPKGMVCRHLDDDQFNNALDNLRWGTHSDNMYDMYRNNRKPKTHCKRGHQFTKANTYVYPDGRRRCTTCDKESSWYRNSLKSSKV